MPDETPKTLKVAIDWNTEPTPRHANLVLAVQSQPDVFALVFADGAPFSGRVEEDEEGDGEILYGRVVASLRVPASSMGEFVLGVVDAWNAYVAAQPPGAARDEMSTFTAHRASPSLPPNPPRTGREPK